MTHTIPQHTLRKSILIALTGIFLLGIFSCQKEENPIIEIDPAIESNQINFSSPKVGQKSQYILLIGEDIKDKNNQNFEYKNDTLEIEILESTDNGYLVEERLTQNSASLNGENNVAFPSKSIQFLLKIEDGNIEIENLHVRLESRLFHINENDQLVTSKFDDLEIKMESWKTNLPFQMIFQTGYLTDYQLFDKQYPHLNVMINNRPMQEELSGYTHIYSPENGLVRSSTYSYHNGSGFGWDLLPE